MLRGILLVLFLAVNVCAQVPIGASKKEVIDKLGWPKSTSTAGTREVLYYPEFSVLIANDRVEKLQFNPKDGNLPNTYSPPERVPKRSDRESNTTRPVTPQEVRLTPEQQLGPVPIMPEPSRAPIQPVKAPPIQTQPVVRQYNPPPRAPVDPFAPLKQAFTTLTVFFVVLVVGGIAVRIFLKKVIAAQTADDHFGLPPRVKPIRPDLLKDGWTLGLLQLIEWHRFEQVVAEYHRLQGNRAELTSFGADGGVDVEVYRPSEVTPFLLIQCKAWANEPVGVALVRELYGVAAARRIPGTAFHTTSSYTPDARTFAASVNMELVDGPGFIDRIKRLPLSTQSTLHEFATAGDYTTPTCPSCGTKMVAKVNKAKGTSFWGCQNYPRCHGKLHGSA